MEKKFMVTVRLDGKNYRSAKMNEGDINTLGQAITNASGKSGSKISFNLRWGRGRLILGADAIRRAAFVWREV